MDTVVSLRKACYILSLSESAHCARLSVPGARKLIRFFFLVPFRFALINGDAMSACNGRLVVVAVMLGLHAHSVFLGHAKIGWGISCSALVYTAVLVVIAVYRLVSCGFFVPSVPQRVWSEEVACGSTSPWQITAEESNPRAAVLSKTAFWILQVALEWVAVVSLLLITVYAGNYYSGRESADVDGRERENENENLKMEVRGRGQSQEEVSPPAYSSDAGKAGSSV